MTRLRSRPFRGLMSGTREDGLLSLEFVGSDVGLHCCPIWSIDDLLALPNILGPGIYILVGAPADAGGKLRAIVGEGGMLQERLAAHANDDKLDFVWEVVAITGPRVMTETQRLMLQRRFVDEINHFGRARVANPHDADRFTRTEYESAIADRVMEDLRPLFAMTVPGIIADIEPVLLPIGARIAFLPRGVDLDRELWTDHEMRFKGAHALARMRGRETVIVPGSKILGCTKPKLRWLRDKRDLLLRSGVLRPASDSALLDVVSFIKFESAHEAATFVAGGASVSARLVWIPICLP
ncbi:hypothetical protein [Methylobacterium sp. SI9]|uniref:hypothetical protein n=1 Tax=Methylobacterium guangdongense TaxID=3138811 RepID=UPI00313D9EA5